QWGSFFDWNLWFSTIRLKSKVKSLLEGVFNVAWWSIWVFRNRVVSYGSTPSRSLIFDDIVDNSFHWSFFRCNRMFSWEDCFFIIAVQTPGSGISILLAVGTPSTGSGNLYCQWELSPGSRNALCILFPTYDMEGDILYLEKLLNEDPSLNLPLVKTEDLKQVDATLTKTSIEEPPELGLKNLLSHLEYAFLEGTDKLPVITSKELKDEENPPF
nr:RNA-directed DNA polymerase, eukaryota [Tanacetum cinerariifolium]